jgi:hypothetical protein
MVAFFPQFACSLSYRVELSHLTGVWNDIAVILGRVVQDGLSPKEVDQLVLIFRIVRNGVAGVVENQDLARYGLFRRFFSIRVVFSIWLR